MAKTWPATAHDGNGDANNRHHHPITGSTKLHDPISPSYESYGTTATRQQHYQALGQAIAAADGDAVLAERLSTEPDDCLNEIHGSDAGWSAISLMDIHAILHPTIPFGQFKGWNMSCIIRGRIDMHHYEVDPSSATAHYYGLMCGCG